MESPKKANKISEVVRLRQLLKKWRNFANSSKTKTTTSIMSPNHGGIHESIIFLKRTISSLSSSDDGSNKKKHSGGNSKVVLNGYLAVCVDEELERLVIPTHHLGHTAFGFLLQKAKEEFGFQQTGILRIPCIVPVFQSVVKMVEGKKKNVANNGKCRLDADKTCGGLLLNGGEMSHHHLQHSRHHPL